MNTSIELTQRSSVAFNAIIKNFEIKLEYFFDEKPKKQVYYSIYKDVDLIEISETDLNTAIERILILTSEVK